MAVLKPIGGRLSSPRGFRSGSFSGKTMAVQAMQIAIPALFLLHLGTALPLLAALAVPRLRGRADLACLPPIASMLLLLKAGWWPDMPWKPLVIGLALLPLWAGLLWWGRQPERPGAAAARSLGHAGGFFYGGFLLALGVQSLRHDTPLGVFPALAVLLLGALLPLPMQSRRLAAYAAMALLTAALLAGAAGLFTGGG